MLKRHIIALGVVLALLLTVALGSFSALAEESEDIVAVPVELEVAEDEADLPVYEGEAVDLSELNKGEFSSPPQQDGDLAEEGAPAVAANPVTSQYGVDLTAKYYVSVDNPFYRKGYEGECTWYCWGRAYEKCGEKLSWSDDDTFGDAKYWYSNARAWASNHEVNYTTGTEPKENSIAVTTSGVYGHVVFIERIANGKVYYSECNYFGSGVYSEGEKSLNDLPFVGYIYPGLSIDAKHFPDEAFRNYIAVHYDVNQDGSLSNAERDVVTYIDVNDRKDIKDLTGIGLFRNLEALYCTGCGLSALDVSGCKSLVELYCSKNAELKSLKVKGCAKLGQINCSDCGLVALDLSDSGALYILEADNNRLIGLSISKTPVWRLSCRNNGMKTLILNKECENLRCQGNSLSRLDISECERLVGLRKFVSNKNDKASSRTVSSKGVIHYESEHTMAELYFDAYTRLMINGEKIDGWKNVPTSVKVNKSGTVELKMTDTLKLKATIKPTSAVPYVSWKSLDTKVAKVSSSGKVTPVKPGTATIKVSTYNGKTAKVKVKVVAVKPDKVQITKGTKATMTVGDKLTLKAKLLPAGATSKLTWKSSDTKVATVSSSGVVKAKKKGTATITVKTANGKKATIKITVKAKPVEVFKYAHGGQISAFAQKTGLRLQYEKIERFVGWNGGVYYIKEISCQDKRIKAIGHAVGDTYAEADKYKSTYIDTMIMTSPDFTLCGVKIGMSVDQAKDAVSAYVKKHLYDKKHFDDEDWWFERRGNVLLACSYQWGMEYTLKNGKVSKMKYSREWTNLA